MSEIWDKFSNWVKSLWIDINENATRPNTKYIIMKKMQSFSSKADS